MRGRTLDEEVTLLAHDAGLNMSATGWTQQQLARMVAHAQAPITLRDVETARLTIWRKLRRAERACDLQ
jgi:hypothetical protein